MIRGLEEAQTGLRGSRQLRGRKAALVLVAVEKRGRGTGRARMEVIPDFKSATLISVSETKRGARHHGVHRRPQEFRRSARSGFQARASHPTPANRTAERGSIGGASGRPRDWQPEAVADRDPPRRESGDSSRFIWMNSSFATIAASYPWPRSRRCSGSELGASQPITDDSRRRGGILNPTPTALGSAETTG